MRYVRATKPEDERFFKDIVLNSILREIAHENGITPHPTPSKPQKRISTKLIWLPLIALVTILGATLLQPDTTTTAEQTHPKQSIVSQPQTTPPQQPITKPLIQAQKDTPKIPSQPKHTVQIDEHEQAKAALLQQMKE